MKKEEFVDVKTEEQLASEAMLNQSILEDEVGGGDSGGAQGAIPENTAGDALYGIISLVPMILTVSGLKNAAGVWSDGVCRGISDATIPVLRKYTFGQKIITFLETGGGIEEFGLVMALAPVVLATAKAYQLDVAEKNKAEEKEVSDVDTDLNNGKGVSSE